MSIITIRPRQLARSSAHLRAACLAGGAFAAVLAGAPAQAALVSACSGVSLPRSTVTNILQPVLTGIVTPIQNTVNPILGLPIIGGVLGLPPLSIDLTGPTGLLTTAAAGAPITLSVLKTDGTVLGPADTCQTTTDSISLNTPAGIALGGNVISGLGNGAPASAGEINSIALGNGASTTPGATGSVALGNGANANVANSVALGAGSAATRGATAGSVGEVSVGAPGALRQITNVANGTAPTDAATVGQVTASANLAPIQYSNPALPTTPTPGVVSNSTTLVGLTAGTPVALHNVAPGVLAAGSTDAVDGGQLFTTNANVTINTANIAGNTTAITNLTNGTAGLVQQTGGAPGAGQITIGAATGGNSLSVSGTSGNRVVSGVANGVAPTDAANVGQIGAATANAVQYDTLLGARTNKVTLAGGAAGPVTVTNVAPGAVAAGSTDAVNGAQLAATNASVTTNTTSITNLTNGTAGLVQQAGASAPVTVAAGSGGTTVNFTGTGGTRTLSGVTAGVAATDAVNLGQVTGLIGTSAAASPIQYSNPAAPTTPTPGVVSNSTTLVGLTAGAPVALHNVAAGVLGTTSTDAVNGSQLNATNAQTATNTTNIAGNTTAITNLNNGTAGLVQQTGGSPGAGQIVVGGGTGGTSVTIAGTGGNRTLTGLLPGLGASDAATVGQLGLVTGGAFNAVNYDINTAGGRTNNITLIGGAPGPVSITNVGPASLVPGSTGAVNGGQLAATNTTVTSIVNGQAGAFRSDNTAGAAAPAATGANATAGGFGSSATGAGGLALGNGAVSTGTGSVALGSGSTDGGNARVVSVGGVGSERRITNVGPGTNGTDAVNLSQLQAATTTFGTTAAGLQGQINSVNFDLNQVRRRANGGTAGAMAVAGLPQAFEPGKSMIGGAFGFWNDQVAFAIGASRIVGEQTVLKAGASISGQGVGGFNAGIGYQF